MDYWRSLVFIQKAGRYQLDNKWLGNINVNILLCVKHRTAGRSVFGKTGTDIQSHITPPCVVEILILVSRKVMGDSS